MTSGLEMTRAYMCVTIWDPHEVTAI